MNHSTRTPFFPPNLQDYASWVATHGLYAPYGKCQCGCGGDAPVARETSRKYGYLKHHPCRFIRQHGAYPDSRLPVPLPILGQSESAIPLTQGKFAIVDAADREWLAQWTWYAVRARRNLTFYAVRSETLANGKQHRITMHEILRGKRCDHVDGDGLNNRRANLRDATIQQNNFNRRPTLGSSSRYKGVTWHKRNKRWQAAIKRNNKTRYLGFFLSETEAARAYDAAARELFGEFAWLNFQDDAP